MLDQLQSEDKGMRCFYHSMSICKKLGKTSQLVTIVTQLGINSYRISSTDWSSSRPLQTTLVRDKDGDS